MAIEKVKLFFEQFNMAHRIMEFERSSATVALAAEAVGCEPDRIAKTLAFQDVDGCVLIVTTGESRIDNSKFKNTFNMKARMLKPDEVLLMTGYSVGGVCPFDILNDRVKIYMDVSVKSYDTVFPACGNSASAIELTPSELFRFGKATQYVDVCK